MGEQNILSQIFLAEIWPFFYWRQIMANLTSAAVTTHRKKMSFNCCLQNFEQRHTQSLQQDVVFFVFFLQKLKSLWLRRLDRARRRCQDMLLTKGTNCKSGRLSTIGSNIKAVHSRLYTPHLLSSLPIPSWQRNSSPINDSKWRF